MKRRDASVLPNPLGRYTIALGHPFFPQRFAIGAFATFKVSGAQGDSGMPNAMSDRRVAPRYPLILLAEVTDLVSATKFTARTSDLSRTGCYIDMLNPLPRGTKIHVRLRKEKDLFESAATVMYVSPGLGIGVAFSEDLSITQQATLQEWLTAAAIANP